MPQPFYKVYPTQNLPVELRQYAWPRSSQSTGPDWRRKYDLCALRGTAGMITGSLDLARTPQENGRFVLEMRYRRVIDGDIVEMVTGRMRCLEDALATPVEWQWSSAIHNQQGVLESTVVEKSGMGDVSGQTFQVTDAAGKLAQELRGTQALSWALFEAVERMPAGKAPPLKFDLIDHFDQPKTGHQIRFHETLTLLDGTRSGRAARLDVFIQKGTGILPTYYYRDQAGRIVFVMSGLEAYVLKTETQETV